MGAVDGSTHNLKAPRLGPTGGRSFAFSSRAYVLARRPFTCTTTEDNNHAFPQSHESRPPFADDFVDREFNPIQKTLTIRSAVMSKPPNGKRERICIGFEEDPRTAFFANGQIKFLAKTLRRADTDQWIGARIVVTSHEVKSPAGE